MNALLTFAMILLVCQLLDLISTMLVIKAGGYEANGLLARLARVLEPLPLMGPWAWLVWTKLALAAGIWYVLIRIAVDYVVPDWLTAVVGALAVFYIVTVINNFIAYRQQRRVLRVTSSR